MIMREAESWGHRSPDSNPCTGIRRYRLPHSERFLSSEEYRRLGTVLARHEKGPAAVRGGAALLLLTGCRKSEILMLRWSEYRDGNLSLRDSKTGPRTVWLCTSGAVLIWSSYCSVVHCMLLYVLLFGCL